MNRWLYILILLPLTTLGQSFAPAPGEPGSTAIHKDSSVFVAWATDVSVSRGYANISYPGAGFVSYGTEADGVGEPDGLSVVSLGDGGEAIIYFDAPIYDGPGPDFAVFENGFIDHYMEFAFVEVSSDGIHFVRFDAVSETPVDTQLDNFSVSDCRYVHNLAGKYRQLYGTPFDLSELAGAPDLDVNNIYYIRLIDVVGSVDSQWGSYDSQGNLINDPFPTEFESGGFDLDGVGVIHQQEAGLRELAQQVALFPNPTRDQITINCSEAGEYNIADLNGHTLFSGTVEDSGVISLAELPSGVYFCILTFGDTQRTIKIHKL